MKIDIALKPELFCSSDETRPHLTMCHLDTENRCMAATDGHRLIVVPVDCEPEDHSGWITPEALTAARKADREQAKRVAKANAASRRKNSKGTVPTIERATARIVANGKLATGHDGQGPTFQRPGDDCAFPPYRKVMDPPRDHTAVTFGINGSYLADAAKALGSENVRITVYVTVDEHGVPSVGLNPVYVRSDDSSVGDAVCLIMPVRLTRAD